MSAEIKRGYPFPNGLKHREAQEVGPYPVWEQWKREVEEKFPGFLKNCNSAVESFFKDFYNERRKYQKTGNLNREKIEELWEDILKKDPDFEEKYREVVDFIREKTEPPQARKRL